MDFEEAKRVLLALEAEGVRDVMSGVALLAAYGAARRAKLLDPAVAPRAG
jgi:hypothetical protein